MLPLLQVGIEMTRFFLLAPVVLVLFHLGLVTQLVLLALAWLFMPQFVALLAPGFDADPEKFSTAVALTSMPVTDRLTFASQSDWNPSPQPSSSRLAQSGTSAAIIALLAAKRACSRGLARFHGSAAA